MSVRLCIAYTSTMLVGLPLVGCRAPDQLRSPDRYHHGVVFVLPGIEGPSVFNRDIAIGLDEGGVRSAIELYDWTFGVPGDFAYNLSHLRRNRAEAGKLAARIVAHCEKYPGTPVCLVGHSGGGGVAVMALEALPENQEIDLAVLLAPALSPEYDLCTALRHTRRGIVNFHSPRDVGLLCIGTTVLGSMDREHCASAGAVGFGTPSGLGEEDRRLYTEQLRQVSWTPEMREVGANGTHFGWASQRFASEYLAPLILGRTMINDEGAASTVSVADFR